MASVCKELALKFRHHVLFIQDLILIKGHFINTNKVYYCSPRRRSLLSLYRPYSPIDFHPIFLESLTFFPKPTHSHIYCINTVNHLYNYYQQATPFEVMLQKSGT